MTYEEERKKLIEQAHEFVSFPPPDYSKMTNEQIRRRTEIVKKSFEVAFDDDSDEDDSH
ncbi:MULTISPECIES: hypothetical protein [unclassified Virgibacillus]|uniref:hypothetical protein n=1 Tax=unclassified Virgibacillus TaxID=2620237 RepID=UPI0018DD7AE4|nr:MULTISPECIES: hypothetical protein [unclassified Virgibacillus]MBS7427450.1 hypothetical protein [Virgibacillus sp. 19R1-5]